MTDLNISIPADLEPWVSARVAEGSYSDASAYVGELVRRDREAEEKERRWLKRLIDVSLASGVIAEEPEAVVERIIARRHARQN